MRLGTHLFRNEQEAVASLLAEGFLPIGQGRHQHYRHPDRDADRWVQRADMQPTTKFEQSAVQVRVWRAFT